MAGSVHIPWYATGFRGDKLEAAVAEVAPIALRYGAASYALYRAREDRYKVLQIADFDRKADWERYWNGPEMTRFRTVTSGWWQVPIVYQWQDLIVAGRLDAEAEADAAA